MKKHHALLALLTFSAIALVGCSSTPPVAVQAAVDTTPPVRLDVLTVTVMDRTGPQPVRSPYNTNNFQPTIANAIRRWASEKLVAVGTSGEAVVTIRDATLDAQPIKHGDDMFTREQTSQYVAHAAVTIDVRGHAGQGQSATQLSGSVNAEASRHETLPEDPTAIERQNAYYKIYNGLMQDLTNNLKSAINGHLRDFIITAPVLPGTSP
ncbi:MAG: hypothetical protein JO126_02205 [Alphaproteobacteria bacterium]|nr:hypothetical protein [Alphaproteobacteria bacterium]